MLYVDGVGSPHLVDKSDSIVLAAEESTRYPYLLLLTLSVHSVIAGMALGAQPSLAGFLVILIAILAHKSAAGFALGVSLHRIGTGLSRARAIVAGFAVMTPLGIGLGTGVSALLDSAGEQVFEALFDAIAGGTFLYMASLDILREEFIPPRDDRRIRWIWVAIGFGLIAIVAIWT